MSTMKTRSEREELIIGEQAAEWLLRLEDGNAQDREAFLDWIARSPLHVGAFLRASAVDSLLTEVDPGRSIAIEPVDSGEMPDLAMARDPGAERAPAQRRNAWRWATAAGVAGIAAALGFFAAQGGEWRMGKDRFSTVVGEQRTVPLEDGSVLYLNTGSRVTVRFSAHERLVRLESGEALFKVSRDAARPFRVRSGSATIQALGTQFNVRREETASVVSVIEGAVQVSAEESRPVRLSAGEETVLREGGAAAAPRPADLVRVEAWRSRRLVFQDDTLASIAAEFNRYNVRPRIQVEGTEIAARRFAAAFDADDPESLIVVLGKDPTLRIEQRTDAIVIKAR